MSPSVLPRPDRRVRPSFERLEDRRVPALLFVVPGNVATDASHFHDLASADAAATVGDTIQIEPNSAPGAATLDKALTVQGDPAYGPPTLPQVGPLTLAAKGITLNDLNLSTVTINAGQNGATVSHSLVAGLTDSGGSGSGLLTLTEDAFTAPVTLNGNTAGATNDVVQDNTFSHAGGGLATLLTLARADGSTVTGNTFTSPVAGDTAVAVQASTSVTVRLNVITLTGGGFTDPVSHLTTVPTGVEVTDQAATFAGTTVVSITNNAIDTLPDQGVGIRTDQVVLASPPTLGVAVAGNDLVQNKIGLLAVGPNSGVLGVIDAGGGPLNSAGGNDFHGFGSTAGGRAAIETAVLLGSGAVNARFNVWSGDPNTAVSAAAGTTIDTSNPLNPNEAFVQDLYRHFLKRTGTVAELDGWANAIGGLGQAGIARAIIRSDEALRRLIEDLYLGYLGRPADAAGENSLASFLEAGHTEEDVIAVLAGSAEFQQQANRVANISSPDLPDANFVRGLFVTALGRNATPAEVSLWVNQASAHGHAFVAAAVLRSQEFRTRQVSAFYGSLFHRAGSSSEVSAWVNSGLDLLSIEVGMTSSGEFFTNG